MSAGVAAGQPVARVSVDVPLRRRLSRRRDATCLTGGPRPAGAGVPPRRPSGACVRGAGPECHGLAVPCPYVRTPAPRSCGAVRCNYADRLSYTGRLPCGCVRPSAMSSAPSFIVSRSGRDTRLDPHVGREIYLAPSCIPQ